jgi:hypothetical protein
MRVLKAYMIGVFPPSTIWMILYLTLWCLDYKPIKIYPFMVIALLGPIACGAWNSLFLGIGNKFPGKTVANKITFAGFLMGVIISIAATFFVPFFKLLLDWGPPKQYLSLILWPIIYIIVWRYVIHPLNWVFNVYGD